MALLTPKEASRYLKISTNALATWRHQKGGPNFIRTGRFIKYAKETLDAYPRKNTVETMEIKDSHFLLLKAEQ
jgi:helix-turn-helix protein